MIIEKLIKISFLIIILLLIIILGAINTTSNALIIIGLNLSKIRSFPYFWFYLIYIEKLFINN